MSIVESYAIRVKGKSLSDWSGAVPEDIATLINKPSKDSESLLFQIVKTQIELLCQKGDTEGAMEAFNKWKEKEKQSDEYRNPLNTFKRDHQNGKAPYQGAHCFFGAIRDASGKMFDLYYKSSKDRGEKASDKHLRKSIMILPNHIFLYRDEKRVMVPDKIEGQQPTEDVKGFARYEVIHHPFEFEFTVHVMPAGPFKKFLSDKTAVLNSIKNSTMHGQGSRRSAGYGMWEVTEAKVEDWSFT